MPDLTPSADKSQIRSDLSRMTARWNELPEPAVFELRAFAEGKHPQTARFKPAWIDEAVEWAADMNALGFNVYPVRNPIRADVTKSASDEDILGAFFVWADCDDPESEGNVRRFDGPPHSYALVTGRTPHTRVHVYWELDEPITDLGEWRSLQEDIASHFQSDRSVVNPSRIMRLAGTVAHPATHKRSKGYTAELSELRPGPAKKIGFEQIRRVFPRVRAAQKDERNTGFQFDVGEGQSTVDRERLSIQAMSGREWHNAVIRLVASYVAKGLSDAEIHALTDPLTLSEYTVEQTRREVQTAINGAREKGWTPPPSIGGMPAAEEATLAIDNSVAFLSDLRPLEYLIDGLLPAGVCYSLTGYAGHGKTTLALQFALSVARGELFADRETSKGRVLILAGENPYNVKWQYAAALAARGLQPDDVDIDFVQGRFSIRQSAEALRQKMSEMPDLKLIIVDSLQAFFEGDNDNDNTQMVEMAHRLRGLAQIDQKPAILIIAHPAGKTPSKDTLVPRGGGAFLNEIDGNLTVWSQDSSQQTLHHSQKFRGAGFDPIEWVMQSHEFPHLTDIHGTALKLPVSRPETHTERTVREIDSDNILRRYLEAMSQGIALSVREGAGQFGITRWRMQQIVETAKAEKLIRRHAKTWVLTQGGKDYLEAKNAGA